MKQELYKHFASKLEARGNCITSKNQEWFLKHEDTLIELTANYMPRGSGIDNYPKIDLEASNPNKLIFTFGYHHMNENGFYVGWTEHKLIVRPSLAFGFELKITGPNRNDVKDYLYDTFDYALRQEIEA